MQSIGFDLTDWYRPVLANPGTLVPHPIVRGRRPRERIDWIVAFGGQAFIASNDWSPISVYGPGAVALIPLDLNFEGFRWGDGPRIPVGGWLHAATRTLDRGRVVVLGEGGMCTAQYDDLEGEIDGPLMPYGINAPYAPQNGQFCLNVVRWLSGLLDE
jgi:hypothetical protein